MISHFVISTKRSVKKVLGPLNIFAIVVELVENIVCLTLSAYAEIHFHNFPSNTTILNNSKIPTKYDVRE